MALLENRRKLEFALWVTLVSVVAAFLMAALEWARQEMEEAAVQEEAAAQRVELMDRISHREAWGGALPASRNPVQWTGRTPVAYMGELDSPPETVGVWYFDRKSGVLAYRYQRGGEARFRLALGAGGTAAQGKLAGVGLVRLENAR